MKTLFRITLALSLTGLVGCDDSSSGPTVPGATGNPPDTAGTAGTQTPDKVAKKKKVGAGVQAVDASSLAN